MKSTAIWVLRHLLIPVGFIWAIGIFNIELPDTDGVPRGTYYSFDSTELSKLEITPANFRMYCDSLIKNRKELSRKNRYRPYFYFHDLKQLRMFEVQYHDWLYKTHEGQVISWRLMPTTNELLSLSLTSADKKAPVPHEAMTTEEARRFWFPEEAREELRRKNNPPDPMWPIVRTWMLSVYLKGLVFAFILFFIWRMRLKEEYEVECDWNDRGQRTFVFTPLSFVLSVLAWPLVLGIDLYNRFKKTARKAEVLSRRSTMLTLFSKEEQKLLAIGQDMSHKEFAAYLESIGRVRRHSFVLALAITMTVGSSLSRLYVTVPTVYQTVHLVYASITPSSLGTDRDVGMVMEKRSAWMCLTPYIECTYQSVPVKRFFHFPYSTGRILRGFSMPPDGVPKFLDFFQLKLIY